MVASSRADAGLPSTFSEQTNLSNPDEGGVHDGKSDLDVGWGDLDIMFR